MSNKIIYIAGPYRSKFIYKTRRNIEDVRRVAESLAYQNVMFFAPHLNSALMDGLNYDKYFLDMGLEFVRRCDAVLIIGSFVDSDGAIAEYKLAQELGKPIFHEAKDAVEWAKKGSLIPMGG